MEAFSALLALWTGNSPVTGGGGVTFSFISAWTNDWVNNRDAGGLRRYRAHHDVTVMLPKSVIIKPSGKTGPLIDNRIPPNSADDTWGLLEYLLHGYQFQQRLEHYEICDPQVSDKCDITKLCPWPAIKFAIIVSKFTITARGISQSHFSSMAADLSYLLHYVIYRAIYIICVMNQLWSSNPFAKPTACNTIPLPRTWLLAGPTDTFSRMELKGTLELATRTHPLLFPEEE